MRVDVLVENSAHERRSQEAPLDTSGLLEGIHPRTVWLTGW